MTEVVIWVATVLVVAFFSWVVVSWPRMALRVTAGVLFGVLWIGALQFANMDLVWRFAMPTIMVAAMLFVLVKRVRPNHGTA